MSVREFSQSVIFQHFIKCFHGGLCFPVPDLQTKGSIFTDRTPFKQMIPLEHVTDPCLSFLERSVTYIDRTFFRSQKAGEKGKQG